MEENKKLKAKMMRGGGPDDIDLSSSYYLMNINEDPMLTGYIRQEIQDGLNQVGKQGSIKISGIGVN